MAHDGGTTLARVLQDDIFRPPMVAISAGRIPGVTRKDKFGFDPSIDTSFEPIWGHSASKTFRTTETTMTISSDSSDDAAGEIGARTVVIEGVDQDYNFIVETAILNGLNGVNIGTNLMIVERIYADQSGSNKTNVGKICVGTGIITDGIPAVVEACILADEGQTTIGWLVVPLGYTYYLLDILFSSARSATANTDFRIRYIPFGGSWRTIDQHATFQNIVPETRIMPQEFDEKSIIVFEAKGSTSGAPVSVRAEFLKIEDAIFEWPK